MILKKSASVKKVYFVRAIATIAIWGLIFLFFRELGHDIKTVNTGTGMYPVEITCDNDLIVQDIRAEHRKIGRYGFYISSDCELEGGGVEISLLFHSRVLATKTISYSEARFGKYTYVDWDASVFPFLKSTIQLHFLPDENGNYPLIYMSPKSANLREMSGLSYNGVKTKDSLLTSLTYTNAVDNKITAAIVLMIILIPLAIFDPGIFKEKKIFAFFETILSIALMGYMVAELEKAAAAFSNNSFNDSEGNVYFWSIAIVIAAIICLMLVFRSVSIGGIVGISITGLIYSIEYFVRLYRGMPFKLNDLRTVSTLANVKDHYSLKPSSLLAWCWIIWIFIVVLLFHLKKSRNSLLSTDADAVGKKRKIIWHTLLSFSGVLFLCIGYFFLTRTSFLENQGFERTSGFFYLDSYQENGYVISSILNVEANQVKAPDGYSEDAVAAILEPYLEVEQKAETPNIILIGNESLADLTVLGDLNLTEDIFENIYSLENSIRGFVTVSCIGGGTANSEYEALSGCSTAFMPESYYPYIQSVNEKTPSLVSQLKYNDYYTVAMHPFSRRNYNRNNVYKYLGFDEMIWGDEFETAETVNGWVSDKATYEKIIELYENKGNQPLFVQDFTIQNHGGYEASDNSTVYAQNAYTAESATYLTAVKESDKAFGFLIDYFAKADEPTIICMYGDHQPKFEDESFYNSIDSLESNDVRLYKTPFVIWANFEIEAKDNVDMGLCYLPSYLLSVAKVHMSPYFLFVRDMMDVVPDLSVHGCTDAEGHYYSDVYECDALDDYRIVQYNNMFDKKKNERYYR